MGEDIQQRGDACEQDETKNVLELGRRVVERIVTVAVEDVSVEAELRSRCRVGRRQQIFMII